MPEWKIVKEQDYYGILITGFVKAGPEVWVEFSDVQYGDDCTGVSEIPIKRVEIWALEPKYQEIIPTERHYYIINFNGKKGIYYINEKECEVTSHNFENNYLIGRVNQSFQDLGLSEPSTETAQVTENKILNTILGGFVLSPSFDNIEIEPQHKWNGSSHVILEKNKKVTHGLLRFRGNWLVKPEYDKIWKIRAGFITRANNKYELRLGEGEILFVTKDWRTIRDQIGRFGALNYNQPSNQTNLSRLYNEFEPIEKEIEKDASNIEKTPEPKEKEAQNVENNLKPIEKNKEPSDEKKNAKKSRWFHF